MRSFGKTTHALAIAMIAALGATTGCVAQGAGADDEALSEAVSAEQAAVGAEGMATQTPLQSGSQGQQAAPPAGFQGQAAPPAGFQGQAAPPAGFQGQATPPAPPPAGFQGQQTPGFQGQQTPGFQGQQTPGFQGQQMPSFQGQQMPSFQGQQAEPPAQEPPAQEPQQQNVEQPIGGGGVPIGGGIGGIGGIGGCGIGGIGGCAGGGCAPCCIHPCLAIFRPRPIPFLRPCGPCGPWF